MKNQDVLDSRTTADDFINYFYFWEPIMLNKVDKIQKEESGYVQETQDTNFRDAIMFLIEIYGFLSAIEE